MEINLETLRKFFLEAFEQTVIPRLDSIDKRLDRLEARMDRLEARMNGLELEVLNVKKELLDLREKTLPEFSEIQAQFKIVVRELEFMKKSGGSKFVLKKIEEIEKFLAKKSRELLSFKTQLKEFEIDLKKLKQSHKRKIAK